MLVSEADRLWCTPSMLQVALLVLCATAQASAVDDFQYLSNGVVDSSLYSAPTTTLKGLLMENDDKTTAPPAAKVSYSLALQSFTSDDTTNQNLQCTGWRWHYWTDQRLRWNSTSFSGV